MKLLFLHPNMPGQFKHLCRAFAKDPNNTVVFITKPRPTIDIPGVHKVEYTPPREPTQGIHHYLISFERAVLQGQEVWRMCKKLKDEEGFIPDVIVAHPGWGDAFYIKDIYPDAPVLNFLEFYYNAYGADVNFDPNEKFLDDDQARVRTKNAMNNFNMLECEWAISPTHWQKIQHPKEIWPKISVIHDGIDTNVLKPAEDTKVTLEDGTTLTKSDEVVTYVARNFEPYRGFPTFMQAAAEILKRRPNCHIIAIGADGVSYGKRPPPGKTYRQIYTEQAKFCDPSRIHFVGYMPYAKYISLLQLSGAHIYLTYPFVLSWSSMEAMACECLMIASRTQPVEEVMQDRKNALLVDFFSPEDIADRVDEVFAHPNRMQDIRKAARQTILDHYALDKILPLQMQLITDLAEGRIPPPAAKTIEQMNPAPSQDNVISLATGN